jgi:hypothetical protein
MLPYPSDHQGIGRKILSKALQRLCSAPGLFHRYKPLGIEVTTNSYTKIDNMASNFGSKPLLTTVLLMTLLAAVTMAEARELSTTSGGHDDVATKAMHKSWMAEHGRIYSDEAERARRFDVFKTNANFIGRSNAAKDKKYSVGINKFADMTTDEFAAMFTGLKPIVAAAGAMRLTGFEYESSPRRDDNQEVDWRKKGAVTGVKSQGNCGADRNSQFCHYRSLRIL